MKYLVLVILLAPLSVLAQFQTNNDAVDLGGGIYTLTPDALFKAGSIWYKAQTDLRDTLIVSGKLYFGSRLDGADGICFVIQDNCLSAGATGGGIGYGGLAGRSLAVEFDTYRNIVGTGNQNNSDPAFDHAAVLRDSITPAGDHVGVVNHASTNSSLVLPVALLPANKTVKDGAWYSFTIQYLPNNANHNQDSLLVDFNGIRIIKMQYNIATSIFGNNPFAYWGFTSSTGGSINLQQIEITKAITANTLKDTIICPNSTYQVNLPPLDRFKGVNLALNKTSAASSTNANNISSNALNHNYLDRWESLYSDPQWIYVDLGSVYDLDSVMLYWEFAAASTYSIDTAPEGADLSNPASWTTMSNTYTRTVVPTGGNDNYTDVIKFTSPNTRYVRMYGTTRQNGYGYSLYEFEVYGLPKYVWTAIPASEQYTITPNANSSNPIFAPTLTSTQYVVLLPDACKPTSDTIEITIQPYIKFGHDTTFTIPDQAVLEIEDDGYTYNWYTAPKPGGYLIFTGAKFTTPPLYQTTTYYVERADLPLSCLRTPLTAYAEIHVIIPNLFTPNGDEKNDVFFIKGLPLNSHLNIYNRWGDRVYENKDYKNTWDGENESDGLFYYDLKLENGTPFKGWVQKIK